jgi:DNA polymerase III epsilon subunit-like protein
MNKTEKIGYFTKLLAFDVETSSINRINKSNIADGCQIVSIGLIVVDTETYKHIDKLYLEIKWNGESTWSPEAEKIHGLSKEYLEINGVDEEEAVFQIGSFILKYFPMKTRIHGLGHNLVGFDILFLRQLFDKFDMELNLTNRNIDTFTLGNVLLGEFNSDDIFKRVGLTERIHHNAMEDIEFTIEVVRRLKLIWDTKIGL